MNKLLLLFTVLLIIGCNVTSKETQLDKESQKHFEGIVTYEIEYKPLMDKFSAEGLKESQGAKMVMYFKEGNYVKKFYGTNGKLLSQRLLDLEKNRMYSKIVDFDTILYVNVTKPDTKTTIKNVEKSTLLNYPTLGIKTESIVKGGQFGDKKFTVLGEMQFAPELSVDPNWYSQYHEANFNEIIKIGKGVQLQYISKSIFWEQTITAISVERKVINIREHKFKMDENTPMIEL